MFNIEDKIALVRCSNPLSLDKEKDIKKLINILEDMGLKVIVGEYIYDNEYNGEKRARELMNFFKDKEIKAIFDISGGDMANEVLDYLDYKIIQNSNKIFFGYSDLTTVINSIYSQTNNEVILYQIRNLIGSNSIEQIKNFKDLILENKLLKNNRLKNQMLENERVENKALENNMKEKSENIFQNNKVEIGIEKSLFKFQYKFIQGETMEGVIVGGNIRCLLKLAGTKYMPDFKNKILFLEAMSGEVPQMITFLNQLKQIGAFNGIKGILLGTFSKMEASNAKPTIEELVVKIVNNKDIPIAKTYEIGHGADSKALVIGRKYKIEKPLFKFNYKFIQDESMEGIIVGGNIRCLLKLAGTKYMPSFENKILFLEAMSGEVPQMITFLNQLKQIGAFTGVKGIVLGNFTKMEASNVKPTIEELVVKIVNNKDIPIAKTYEIGHGGDSKALIIGRKYIMGKK